MKAAIVTAFLFISFSASGEPLDSCGWLNSWRTCLALINSNLYNVNTTRTPEGGPYIPAVIEKCSEEGAFTKQSRHIKYVYIPGHPDADSNGFVAFPDIDVAAERMTFSILAKGIIAMAQRGVCGAQAMSQGRYVYVRYQNQDLERFKRGPNGSITKWRKIE